MSVPKKPYVRRASGEHPSVVAFRKKIESIADHEGSALDHLNERIEKLRQKSSPPPRKDPRREDDEAVPVDVVEGSEKEGTP